MERVYINKNTDLMKEWDWEKNTPLDLFPDKLKCGSNKKVWWKCEKGHSWQAIISSRSRLGCGCPTCAGRLRCKNLDTGEEFENYTAAAKSVGVTRKSIVFAIKHNSKCKGYRWAAIE